MNRDVRNRFFFQVNGHFVKLRGMTYSSRKVCFGDIYRNPRVCRNIRSLEVELKQNIFFSQSFL